MSENKSWDIAPKARPSTVLPPRAQKPKPAPPPPARRSMDAIAPRIKASAPRIVPTRREAVREPVRGPRVPLGRRRRIKRTRLLILIGTVTLVLVALGEVALWQSPLRVSTVTVEGPGAEIVQHFVEEQLAGSRYLIVPNNSIFFIPEARIRAAVLRTFPDIDAVSIAPSGLTTLALKTTGRATVLWWCGTSTDVVGSSCYQTDAKGFVFAAVPAEEHTASSSTLTLYGALVEPPSGTTPPIGSSLLSAEKLPALIQFIKALRGLGADVVSVTLRADEADIYTKAGTRITYVLGREQAAVNLATSGLPTLNVNDGSLLYVDLRFDSKVFFKKK